MELWFLNLLRKIGLTLIVPLIGPISLMVAGWLVEKHYTSRFAVFTNSMALVEVYRNLNNVPELLALFVNIAPFVGIIFAWSYYTRKKFSENTYKLARVYSTVITALVILYGLIYLT